jgi:hypothetical protein
MVIYKRSCASILIVIVMWFKFSGAFILIFFTDSKTEKHSDGLAPLSGWGMGKILLNMPLGCTLDGRDE